MPGDEADPAGTVACRQLASSARRRIADSTAAPAPASEQAGIVREFRRAWQAKDIRALVGLLDPDVTAIADGGGLVSATHPVRGAEAVAYALVGLPRDALELALLERTVNGQPGLVVRHGGVTVAVLAFDVGGGRVRRVWAVRNPEKLRPWQAA